MADAKVEEDADLLRIDRSAFQRLVTLDEDLGEKVFTAFMSRTNEFEESRKAKLLTDRPPEDPRVFVYLSVGGGAGASFLCSNMALKLREITDKPILVLDLDVEYNVQHHYLGYEKPVGGIRGLFNAPQITEASLEGAVRNLPSKVDLLGGPGVPDDGRVTSQSMSELMRAARNVYEYILIDTTSARSEINDTLVGLGDAAHLVVTPEVTSLHRAMAMLNHYRRLDTLDRVHLVLNKYREKAGYQPKVFQRMLQKEVLATIEYAPTHCLESLNEGTPLVRRNPYSIPGVDIHNYTLTALGKSEEVERQRRFFSIWNLLG
jgi:pilus assembly protein CpaE